MKRQTSEQMSDIIYDQDQKKSPICTCTIE